MVKGMLRGAYMLLLPLLLLSHGAEGVITATTASAAPAASDKAQATLQLCNKPRQCRNILRYPVQIDSGFSCPPFAAKCTFYSVKQQSSATSRTPAAKQVDELAVRQYPKIVNSQVAMPLYQFTSEHSTLEAAKRLLQAGSTAFKFDLKNWMANGKPIPYLNRKGWLPLVTHPDLPYQKLFDMPFRSFIFWAGRCAGPGRTIKQTDLDGIDVYKEMYKLAVYLLKRYNGSGKTFMIGHWEGDWCIRDALNKELKPNPQKVKDLVELLSDKQRAIDDAKRDNKCVKDVHVWHYTEANLVEQSIKEGSGWVSVINTVVKQVKPAIDYVSVSVGGDSLREVNPTVAFHKTLDYAHRQLPYKRGVPEPRVFAGEYYFDLRNRDDAVAIYAPTPQLQKQRGCWAAASGVAWGAPYMMWWAFYDNERTSSGNFRGYWLVDNGNRETPLFKAYQQYYKDANEFVRSVIAATGKPPGDYAFRVWATERLIQLSGRTNLWKPYVRYWGN